MSSLSRDHRPSSETATAARPAPPAAPREPGLNRTEEGRLRWNIRKVVRAIRAETAVYALAPPSSAGYDLDADLWEVGANKATDARRWAEGALARCMDDLDVSAVTLDDGTVFKLVRDAIGPRAARVVAIEPESVYRADAA